MSKSKNFMSMFSNGTDIIETQVPNKTIISSGTEITGTLFKAVGSVFIDGKITSDIEVDGDVVIGVNGNIMGNVNAGYITCSGDVKGNMMSKESIHLCETANVYGDVSSTAIKIDEGAIFCGNCKTEAKFFQETKEIKQDETNI